MKKIVIILILFYIPVPALWAQQQYYNWYLTAGSGAMAYYGDLSHTFNSTKINVPAYQVSIGRNISPSLALTLQGSYGQISGNDRARDWNGTLRTDNENFSRGLNFQTTIRNASLLLSYRLNNGLLLSEHAAVAPYIYGGIGITDFTVFGDLYSNTGQRYYYWNDNTIRNLPQSPATEHSAQVIGQDGNFETQLSGLGTEQNYPTQVFTIPAGVGVKFRISDRFSANLQAGANFTSTGYLDDVNGTYRSDYSSPEQAYAANPTSIMRDRRGNGQNDLYFSAFLSLGYHFNFKKKSFMPPVGYTGYNSPEVPVARENNDAEQPEEERDIAAPGIPTIPAKPAITPVIPFPDLERKAEQATEPQQPSRQTVDINLRILLEDGKMVADTISRQLPDTSALTRPVDRTQSFRKLDNPADVELSTEDTTQIEVPSRKIRVETETPPARLQSQASNNTALAQEVKKLRLELDSLKLQQVMPNTKATDQQAALANQAKPNQQPTEERVQPQAMQNASIPDQPDYSAQIAALRQEVAMLRQELNRERTSQNSQIIGRQKRVATPAMGMTVQAGSGQYTRQEMEQLQNQLTGIQAQLDTLRAQNKVEADPAVDKRIDSLLNLVSRLQILKAAPSRQTSLSQNDADNAEQAQLIESLQGQIARLNESLQTMESKVTAGIDTLSLGVSYTALGNTVVYYDLNDAQLKEDDKQRLTILGRKLQAEPAVLLLIKGYTDQTGNADYNLMLSKKRAENVKAYFVNQLGIQPEQILINYFGQQKASSSASNAHDRRVELELFREN